MMRALSTLSLAAVMLIGLAAPTFAQDPKSAGPAKQLAELLAARKLDSYAIRLQEGGDEFAGVLSFPGQMIVVWAKFAAPAVLNERLINQQYREVYIDLNSASDPATRHMVTDLGADGLNRGEKNQPSDSHDFNGKSMVFDGSWREDKMSEDDYDKAHMESDAAYAQVLEAMVAQLKKAS
ncbi:MAG: hypothetical protein R2712_31245 [Vicinamibacterales bacterium]